MVCKAEIKGTEKISVNIRLTKNKVGVIREGVSLIINYRIFMNLLKKVSYGVDNLVDWVHKKRFARYQRMLQQGKIEELMAQGKYLFVIANFRDFAVAGESHFNKDVYTPYAFLVTTKMMRDYLHHNPDNFHFFTMHPFGLKVLAEEGYNGVIACLEKEFVAIAKNFPESFEINGMPRKTYVDLVNMYLEAGVA